MDEQALRRRIDALYREHAPMLARHIQALTHDPASTEDLLHETFIRAYRALPGFQGRSSMSTWLVGIAINVTRTHLSTRHRRARIDERLAEEPQGGVSPPDGQVDARRAMDRFKDAIAALPDPQREAYVLRVIKQRSWREISDVLGVSISTLHGRVQRAEARVRAMIEEAGQ